MAEERSKQQLTNRRTTLIASLGRAEQFIQNYDAERDRGQVQLRLENLDTVWMGLEDVQTQLEDMEYDDQGIAHNLQIRSKYETQFFQIKSTLQSYLPVSTSSTTVIPQSVCSGLSGVKLPTITLPEFAGDYNEWLAFHDTFVALIHNNPEVHDIQKLHYLRASVKGEAAQLIESISISSANYTIAWQALVSRYANDYLLKKRHLQALLDCPRMKRETATALHSVIDEFERHTKTLRQLGEPIDAWSTMLEHLLCLRLDDGTLKAWEDFATTAENPDYQCLIDFLQRRTRVLESMSVNHQSQPSPSNPPPMFRRPSFYKTVSYAAAEFSPRKCHACDQHHPLFQCPRFDRMSLSDRLYFVNDHHLCHNCFRRDHIARNCQSKFSCRHCKKRHHSLLHPRYHPNVDDLQPSTSRTTTYTVRPTEKREILATDHRSTTNTSTIHSSHPTHSSSANVMLSTVILLVADQNGKMHPARALLDNGSQSNIISDRLCQLLRLERNKTNIPVFGIAASSSDVKHSVRTTIRSRKCDYEMELDFLVMPRITIDLPAISTSADDWQATPNIFLADPTYNKTGAIDMLLGAEHFFNFINPGTRIEEAERSILIESVFGWIVTGRKQAPVKSQPITCHLTLSDPLHEALERFQCIEETDRNQMVSENLDLSKIVTRPTLKFDHGEPIKTLDVSCEPITDQLRFDPTPKQKGERTTKRSFLSSVSKHYCELPQMPSYRDNRYACSPKSTVQLHTYPDASQQEYGACFYARSTNLNGHVNIQLKAIKTKVAELKHITIPQLQLSASLLATRLHKKVNIALDMSISTPHCWSDSTVTLAWLRSPPYNWSTFFANRISTIQTTTQVSFWHHVAGKQNPADLVSRGMKVEEFLVSDLWHHGPTWLKLPEAECPVTSQQQKTPEDILERRKMVAAVQNKQSVNEIFGMSSPYNRLIRLTAYCMCFIRACRYQIPTELTENTNAITVAEIPIARIQLIKLAQADVFVEDMKNLGNSNAVSKHSHLRLVSPSIDSDGILRFVDRLKLSEQPYLSKNPILLPSTHSFTRLVAIHHHQKLVHGGGHATLSAIRQEYWPIQRRRLVNYVVKNCFRCVRAFPVPAKQQTDQFPLQRITPSCPFPVTRIDYAVPVYLMPINKRTAPVKAYISVFTCTTLSALPDTEVNQIQINGLNHYQRLQNRMQETTKLNAVLTVNMVVIIEEFFASLKWPLARVISTIPGSDGLIHVVNLRTSKEVVRRPITKICLLPIEDELNEGRQ